MSSIPDKLPIFPEKDISYIATLDRYVANTPLNLHLDATDLNPRFISLFMQNKANGLS